MGATLGQEEMQSRMQKHWSSWITAEDFSEMASLGLNFVRIPIGYWSVSPIEGEPYVQGAYEWLEKAIGWAGDNGLKVMSKFFSQNEFQHHTAVIVCFRIPMYHLLTHRQSTSMVLQEAKMALTILARKDQSIGPKVIPSRRPTRL